MEFLVPFIGKSREIQIFIRKLAYRGIVAGLVSLLHKTYGRYVFDFESIRRLVHKKLGANFFLLYIVLKERKFLLEIY